MSRAARLRQPKHTRKSNKPPKNKRYEMKNNNEVIEVYGDRGMGEVTYFWRGPRPDWMGWR